MENSPLYRMPDEILLAIRDHADNVTRQLMRRMCGPFLRLVADLDTAPLQEQQ